MEIYSQNVYSTLFSQILKYQNKVILSFNVLKFCWSAFAKVYVQKIPSFHVKNGDFIICSAEVRLGLLAQACHAPGFSTLCGNLFTSRSFDSKKEVSTKLTVSALQRCPMRSVIFRWRGFYARTATMWRSLVRYVFVGPTANSTMIMTTMMLFTVNHERFLRRQLDTRLKILNTSRMRCMQAGTTFVVCLCTVKCCKHYKYNLDVALP